MKRMLIENGIIVTLEKPNRILTGHSLLIENAIIARIVPQKGARGIKAQRIDARGKVVMPGYINAHTHFYSTFARGLAKIRAPKDFGDVLRNLWWRLDRSLTLEDCYYSALVASMEAIRHGATTIIDHHSSPCATRGSLAGIAEAIQESGLRACLCYEVSDRDGEKAALEGIEENHDFIEKCEKADDNRVKALFGLHASFTLEEKTLTACAEAARTHDAGFHIHCAEDLADQEITCRRFGNRVIHRLHNHGILGPKTICAHAVHLDDGEWKVLGETGTSVIHNPQSNMNNAVGVMDLFKALYSGAIVGLGTDAMTCNMLEELRCAIWLQRLAQRNPAVAFREAVDLLMQNNQQIARRYFQNVGQIKEGWCADLILVDYIPPTELNESSFTGHLVFGLSQSTVDTTIVGGKVLMRNKKLVNLDETNIALHSRALSRKIWQQF